MSQSEEDLREKKELVLRSYQVSVAEKCLSGENDIIILPTNAGKTFIAIKLILEHLESRRNGKSFCVQLFIALSKNRLSAAELPVNC